MSKNKNTNKSETMNNQVEETAMEITTAETVETTETTRLAQAIADYRDGKTTLGDATKASGETAINFRIALHKAGVEVTQGRARSWDKQEAIDLLDGGFNATEVAEKLGVSVTSIYAGLRGVYEFSGNSKGSAPAFDAKDVEKMAKVYAEGASLNEVAEQFNTTAATVGKYFKAHGVETRPKGRPVLEIDEKAAATAVKMRKEGTATYLIIMETGLTAGQLAKLFREKGLVKRRQSASNEESTPEVAPEPEVVEDASEEVVEASTDEVSDEAAVDPLEALTVKGLQALLEEHGVEFDKRKSRKAELVELARAIG